MSHPLAGQSVYVRLHRESAAFMGIANGPAMLDGRWADVSGHSWEVVGVTPDGRPCAIRTHHSPAVILYVSRLQRGAPELLLDDPLYVHQRGIGALVHPTEVCGVLDTCSPREAVGLRFDAAGEARAVPAQRKWTDTLPHLDGGAQ